METRTGRPGDAEVAQAIGQRLCFARRKIGWQQQELGERLGVTKTAISHWERGARCLPTVMLTPCASLLGVTVGWLVEGDAPSLSVAAKELEVSLHKAETELARIRSILATKAEEK